MVSGTRGPAIKSAMRGGTGCGNSSASDLDRDAASPSGPRQVDLRGFLPPVQSLAACPSPQPVTPDHDSAAMYPLHALALGAALAVLEGLADLRPVAHGPGHRATANRFALREEVGTCRGFGCGCRCHLRRSGLGLLDPRRRMGVSGSVDLLDHHSEGCCRFAEPSYPLRPFVNILGLQPLQAAVPLPSA